MCSRCLHPRSTFSKVPANGERPNKTWLIVTPRVERQEVRSKVEERGLGSEIRILSLAQSVANLSESPWGCLFPPIATASSAKWNQCPFEGLAEVQAFILGS